MNPKTVCSNKDGVHRRVDVGMEQSHYCSEDS